MLIGEPNPYQTKQRELKIRQRESYKKLKKSLFNGDFPNMDALKNHVKMLDKYQFFGTEQRAKYYLESLGQLEKDMSEGSAFL